MRLRQARLLLVLTSVGFWIDGMFHPYTWPGEILRPTGLERLIRVLWTHSREGNDTWVVVLCWLLLWIWLRERMSRDDQTEE